MLHTGLILHPDPYLQPLPASPASAIELDAKKSPLALLEKTCSLIGWSDTSSPSGREFKSSSLKVSALHAPDKSRFKPYPGTSESNDTGVPKSSISVETGSPSSCQAESPSPRPPESAEDTLRRESKDDLRVCAPSPQDVSNLPIGKAISPYGSSFFPVSPLQYPKAYASYAQSLMALDPRKSISAHLSSNSGPKISISLMCRDPFCSGYHCQSHLSSSPENNPRYLPMYANSSLHPPNITPHSIPFYPYSFRLPHESHACNWASPNGPCDERFGSSEELLAHLRTHTVFESVPGILRTPQHQTLGFGMRFHPYSKNSVLAGGPGLATPTAAGSFYSPYVLYGQRLTAVAGLGFQ